DNVLDVGCGAGWLSRRLAKLVPQGRVVGMDVSDEMIRRARRASVDFENLIFVTGEVEEIPWEPNFFSHVISVESAYYWPDSVAGIREIFRVLKPGGSAWILINYYRDNPHAHQWAVCSRSKHTCSPQRNGANGFALPVSEMCNPNESETILERRRFTPAGGSATRPSFARSKPKARSWSTAPKKERHSKFT